MKNDRPMTQSLVRILLVTAAVLAIPLVANQFTPGEGWSLFDFALVGVLIGGTGLTYELATKRPGTRVAAVLTAGVAAVGGAAVVAGEVDDAPGLILIGIVLVITSAVIGSRAVQRGPHAEELASR